MPRCGTRASVAASGLAVPMSRVRYSWRASAEMTVIGRRSASAAATAVLPTPVGPTMTGVRCRMSGTAKPTFQFLFGKLHETRSAMDIVRGECGAQQSHDELAHFTRIERLSRLERRAARICRREALEPVLPSSKPSPRQIGDELLETATRFEARMRIRRRVNDDAASREWLDLKADAREQLPMCVDCIELGGREVERERQQQPLRGCAVTRQLAHDVLVEDALVRRMLIDDGHAAVGLEEDVGVEDLESRRYRVLA